MTIYASTDPGHLVPLATTLADVSAASALCTATTAARVCAIPVTAPSGIDDFTVVTYDTPPYNGALPAGANRLAAGTASAQTIGVNGTYNVVVSLGGVVTALRVSPAIQYGSVGSSASFPVNISALDASGATIISGAGDPYATPVALGIVSAGTGGYAALVNGVPATSTARSGDAVAIGFTAPGSGGATLAASVGGAVLGRSQLILLSGSSPVPLPVPPGSGTAGGTGTIAIPSPAASVGTVQTTSSPIPVPT